MVVFETLDGRTIAVSPKQVMNIEQVGEQVTLTYYKLYAEINDNIRHGGTTEVVLKLPKPLSEWVREQAWK